MTKQEIIDANALLQKQTQLEGEILRHSKACKHWTLGPVQKKQATDPQFPDIEYRICEFCGQHIKA